jgi:sulfite reductase (NADPH) flavoprotein alpha-component
MPTPLFVAAQRLLPLRVLLGGMPGSVLPLTVLFATETGDCAALAEFAGKVAGRLGLRHRVVDAATYNTTQLPRERDLLVITSTHEGQPPRSAADFFDLVDEMTTPLDHLRFAVLALGDSGYDDFCAAGRRIDRSLERRGASRFIPVCEADVWERARARNWITEILARLAAERMYEAPARENAAAGAQP